jgi:putative ABC transport system substrate-binding protein
VIVTAPRSVTVAAAKASPGMPLVQATGGSPVDVGLAASLARPAGTVTGLVNLSSDLIEKRSELLHEIVPNLRRIGFLQDPNATSLKTDIESAHRAARRLKLQAVFAEAANADQLPQAFARLKESAQALVLLPASWFGAERQRIASLALEHRLPMIGASARFAEVGGLIAYGLDIAYNYRRAAWYVDQILKGVKPGELPIEQPSKFDLVVNLKTAKALGITIPPVVMVRADRVIQ